MTAYQVSAARDEAERRALPDDVFSSDNANAHYRLGFEEGAAWQASGQAPVTAQDIAPAPISRAPTPERTPAMPSADLDLLKSVTDANAADDDRWTEADTAVSNILQELRDVPLDDSLGHTIYCAVRDAYTLPPDWSEDEDDDS